MKKISTLIIYIIGLTGFSQSINLSLDTTQIFQNSDVGTVAYGDIDLDGDNDLLVTGNGPSSGVTSTLYKNDGNGIFTEVIQTSIVNVYSGAAKFADVNNDGNLDLMMTGNTSSPTATANLYINDGSGNFNLSSGSSFEASSSGDIDFGDIDGDNDLDLIMTGQDATGIVFSTLYINNGSGVFSVAAGTPFIGVWKSAAEFIDIDNDNDLDLLICGSDISDVPTTNLYLNDGTGTFSLENGVPFENVEFGDIAFGDTDNDGDQDILITGENSNGQGIAKLYINNGTSFSLLPSTPFPGVSFHSSTFSDFNNDGLLDLLHIGLSSSGLIGQIYENQGSNNFVLADSTIRASYNGSNVVADFNGNNKMDIVVTGTSFTAPVRAAKFYTNQTLVSITENERNNTNFQVYPNPTTNFINIDINSDSQTELEIYNLIGSLVYQFQFTKTVNNLSLNIPAGLYVLCLKNNNDIFTRKIIVE